MLVVICAAFSSSVGIDEHCSGKGTPEERDLENKLVGSAAGRDDTLTQGSCAF